MDTFSSIVGGFDIFKPSNSTQGSQRPRVLKTQFGDGYEQRTADGINSMMQTWNLVWNNVDYTVLDAINTFLEAQGGYKKFLWAPPFPFNPFILRAFVCEEWSWTYSGGRAIGFTALFLERPNP